MRRANKFIKDTDMRFFFSKSEINNIIVKYYINSNLDENYKKYFFFKFINRFHLNSSSARIVNRCILTCRAGGIVRKLKFSRMTFKQLADKGQINGFKRMSW